MPLQARRSAGAGDGERRVDSLPETRLGSSIDRAWCRSGRRSWQTLTTTSDVQALMTVGKAMLH
jgi:hypothetical protein